MCGTLVGRLVKLNRKLSEEEAEIHIGIRECYGKWEDLFLTNRSISDDL